MNTTEQSSPEPIESVLPQSPGIRMVRTVAISMIALAFAMFVVVFAWMRYEQVTETHGGSFVWLPVLCMIFGIPVYFVSLLVLGAYWIASSVYKEDYDNSYGDASSVTLSILAILTPILAVTVYII